MKEPSHATYRVATTDDVAGDLLPTSRLLILLVSAAFPIAGICIFFGALISPLLGWIRDSHPWEYGGEDYLWLRISLPSLLSGPIALMTMYRHIQARKKPSLKRTASAARWYRWFWRSWLLTLLMSFIILCCILAQKPFFPRE